MKAILIAGMVVLALLGSAWIGAAGASWIGAAVTQKSRHPVEIKEEWRPGTAEEIAQCEILKIVPLSDPKGLKVTIYNGNRKRVAVGVFDYAQGEISRQIKSEETEIEWLTEGVTSLRLADFVENEDFTLKLHAISIKSPPVEPSARLPEPHLP